MRRSVQERAQEIEVPPLGERALIERGFGLYRANCVQCHGAPGVAPERFALGLTPVPANMALTAREWKRPAEIYWVVKNGIKMSGMPAWEFRLEETELWAIVAFVMTLPALSPDDYRSIERDIGSREPVAASPEAAISGPGDPSRGKIALPQYACTTCHEIPGVVGARSPVGPPLGGIAARKYLAGVLPNTPPNMIRWLRFPQQVDPHTAMPDLGVSERDARDIAAYLDTLK
jgi:mono/diheme cytochrome c family protein